MNRQHGGSPFYRERKRCDEPPTLEGDRLSVKHFLLSDGGAEARP